MAYSALGQSELNFSKRAGSFEVQRSVCFVTELYRPLIGDARFVHATLLSEKISQSLKDPGAGWFDLDSPLIGDRRFINPALSGQQIPKQSMMHALVGIERNCSAAAENGLVSFFFGL